MVKELFTKNIGFQIFLIMVLFIAFSLLIVSINTPEISAFNNKISGQVINNFINSQTLSVPEQITQVHVTFCGQRKAGKAKTGFNYDGRIRLYLNNKQVTEQSQYFVFGSKSTLVCYDHTFNFNNVVVDKFVVDIPRSAQNVKNQQFLNLRYDGVPSVGIISVVNQTPSFIPTPTTNLSPSPPATPTTSPINIPTPQPITPTLNTSTTSTQPVCNSGWICLNNYNKAYQYSNCMLANVTYCGKTICYNGVC